MGNGWEYVDSEPRGEIFIGESALDLFNRLNALASERALSERERRALDKAYHDAVEEWRNIPLGGPAKPLLPKPKAPVAQAPPKETKPVVGDTLADFAPPDIKKPEATEDRAVVERNPSTDDSPMSRTTLSDGHWGQYSPKPIEELASRAAPAPANDAERAQLEERIGKNEPVEPGEPHPSHGQAASKTPASAGEPVDLFTGTFISSVTDLIVPAATEDIRFERHYRSGRPYFGPFGFGWDHCFNIYLRPLNDGGIALWTGRLRELRFFPDGTGYTAAPGMAMTIEALPVPANGFEVRHTGGVRWRFERPPGWSNAERIPLVAIVDRHGNTLALAYDGQNCLSSVLDDAGRGLRFSYGNCKLLERVTDHNGKRIVDYYHHDEVEHLVRVVLPATAQFPDGVETRYDYDMYAAHPAMRHNIVRITDSSGRIYLENEFAGPEAGWAFNTVQRQLVGDFEFLFEYEQIQWVPADEAFVEDLASRTSVGMPDGSLHVYTFNYRGDLLDHRTRLSADGTYRVVSQQWRHDAHGNVIEAVSSDGVRSVFTYDSANPDARARGNLLQVELVAALPEAPSRIVFRAQYDPVFQQLTRSTDELGQETRLIYDFDLGDPNATGRLVRKELPLVTLEDGTVQQSILRYEHDAHGRLMASVTSGGARTEVHRVAGGLLDGFVTRVIADATGAAETTAFDYDASGFRKTVTAADGGVFALAHNALGQIEELTLPAVDGTAPSQRSWFGDAGAPLRIERPRGDYADDVLADPFICDEVEYDALGRVVAIRSAANTARPRHVMMKLDHDGRLLSHWDELGTRTDFLYDERGLLVRESRAIGLPECAVARYAYDRGGRLVRIEDPAGRVMTIVRDVWGRRVKATLPGGATQHYTWGAGDRLLEVLTEGSPGSGEPSRPLARQTIDYDERGRHRAMTRWVFEADPTTEKPLTTRFVYDADDNTTLVRLPTGASVKLEFDALNRVVRTEDAHGNIRKTTHDSGGRVGEIVLTEREGASSHSRSYSYEYDARSRLRAMRGPVGDIEIDYDERDLVRSQRETGGVVTTFTIGAHGEQLECVRDPGGLSIRSCWKYDFALRLVGFTDPTGESTCWEHDALGRVRRRVLGDGSVWTTTYDAAGRVLEQTLPSGTRIHCAYDAALAPSRLTTIAAAGLAAVPAHDYGYDAMERLVRASTPSGSVERRYDSLGRVIAETALCATVRHTFDDTAGYRDLEFPDGRTERTTLDATGRSTRVTLRTAGLLGGVADADLLRIDYHGIATPASFTHGNGVRTSFAYDEVRRIMRMDLRDGAGDQLDSVRLRHDARGRRAVIQQAFPVPGAMYYIFDACDRLRTAHAQFPLPLLPDEPNPQAQSTSLPAIAAGAVAAPLSYSFQLNAADDRLQETAGAATDNYSYAAGHRIAGIGAQSVTHHVDGHRTRDDRFIYEIDALGRTVRVRDAASLAIRVEQQYDALGRVAAGTIDGAAFTRAFSGLDIIQENLAGELRQYSLHPLSPLPLCVTQASGASFFHADASQSSLCTTSTGGAVQHRYRFDPFGAPQVFAADGVTPVSAPPGHEPMWRGMRAIAGVGLYGTPQRIYDPRTGAFLARDPLLYGDSASPYVYAAQNPIDFADPSGREKSTLGEMAFIETPQSALEREKMDKVLTYDLDPDKTGFRGEDYFGYAFVYGLKQTVYKPIKAWVLDERPKYIDKDNNIRTTRFKPDRSPELAIAFGQIAQFFFPTPNAPTRAPLPEEAIMGGPSGLTRLTALENDIEVAYGTNYTRVGNDPATLRVTEVRETWPNTHDLIVHAESGERRLSPGFPTNKHPYWEVMETHEAQIAEAVNLNPNLRPGQPIRALSCALNPEQAQALANLTGHPVYASPFVVGVRSGPGSLPIEQFIRFDYAAGRWSMLAEKQVWHLYLPK